MASKVTPTDGMVIREDCVLADGVYVLDRGLTVASPGITIDGGGATIVSGSRSGVGVTIESIDGVTLRNLVIRGYRHGVMAANGKGLTVSGCDIAGTEEVEPNTVFLDIWRDVADAYGGAILLHRVSDSVISDNRLMHQQNGLMAYRCSSLVVRDNQASYNSGAGFHLFQTCDSVYQGNCADYCCRFEPREGGLHYGHMGADATGFLAVYGSSRNTFRRNTARLGGDGFFLAGLSPDGTKCGCDDNLFEENDGSLSPNIAFEATFCRGNRYVGNLASRCNYGFWLGFSWDNVIERNQMIMNRQAGIAVENGHGFRVVGNTAQGNGHGVLLWSKHMTEFAEAYPEHLTSYGWDIEDNTFARNVKGIRIAADQDHGIRSMPQEACGRRELRPHSHRIIGNDIQDNRIGIELSRTDGSVIERNILNSNVEANLRQDDTEGTIARNNLGSAGAYL